MMEVIRTDMIKVVRIIHVSVYLKDSVALCP